MFLFMLLSLSIFSIFFLDNRSRGSKNTEYHHVVFNDYLFIQIFIFWDRLNDLRLTLAHGLCLKLFLRLLSLFFGAALVIERDH